MTTNGPMLSHPAAPQFMMCISLHQPWASALFVPDETSWRAMKIHETRSRRLPAHYEKQWLGIHAAKNTAIHTRRAFASLVEGVPSTRVHFANEGISRFEDLPLGMVLGKIMFGPSVETEKFASSDALTRSWGDYRPGRWAWPVMDFEAFDPFILAIGRQGFFNVDCSAATHKTS